MTVDRTRLPDPGPEVSVRFPTVERTVLPSGLELRTIERRDLPVLALLLLVPCGAAHDPAARPGLAALTADLLDEGAGGRSMLELHEAIARIGGHFDTETGYDATALSLLTLGRFRDAAVSLLAAIAFQPRLADDDFDRVRTLRRNRLRQMRDVPAALAEESFAKHLFAGGPYAHLPMGTEASMEAVSPDEVRAFHAEQFQAGRAVLIAVGDADHHSMAHAAARAFGADRPAATSGRPAADDGLGLAPGTRRLVLVDRPGAPQSELRIGRVAAARSTPDYHALVTLNNVLGGQFVSRINLNLREDKGYTYGARSGFDFRRRPGPFSVQASVQTSATADAVREVLREIEQIAADRPPTDRELVLARASVTRGFARHFETPEQIARAVAQQVLHDLPDDYYDRFVDDVRAVDVPSVMRAARRWLPTSDMLTVVVGDRDQIASGLASLGVGEITQEA